MVPLYHSTRKYFPGLEGRSHLVLPMMVVFLLTGLTVQGQDQGFTASAPGSVRMGEQFQYVIEGSEQGDVRLPAMEGFQLLAGPFSSYSSHSTWVNGKMTMKTVVTYTHILRATREGDLTIPPAVIKAGRKEYKTNEVTITVLAGNAPPPSNQGTGGAQAQSGGQTGEEAGTRQEQASGSTDPVFLRVIPSKRDVYVGEQFVSGLKVYTRVNTRPASSAKDLPYEGFYKKSIDPDQEARRETINGQQYVSQVIQRHILIPQKSGKIVIEPYESDWMVQQQVQRRSNDVFDSFFDDPFFNSMREVPQTLYTLPVSINVKPLPAGAPDGFTGGVGEFTMKAELSASEIEVNEALSLKVTVRGTGNLPLLGEPNVNFPPDHDLYDVSRRVNTTTSGNRISGSVTFEYPLVARHAGKFRIAPIQFAWFDPSAKKYRTATTGEFNFTVLKGEGDAGTSGSVYVPGNIQESVENLGTDIRDIARTVPAFTPVAFTLMSKSWYPFSFLVILALAVLLAVWIRVTTRRNADTRLVRNRQASKVAGKHLKKADRYKKSGEEDKFYEAVGKALWGYVADKLNIEISGLSKEVIEDRMRARGVEEDLVSEFNRILDDSEFSRFAPTSARADIEQLYRDAVQLVRNLENSM